MKSTPSWFRENLPAGTYEGVDTETICVAVEAALVASTDMSEDAVYELTKTMFENLEELGTSHAKFQLVSAGEGCRERFRPHASRR